MLLQTIEEVRVLLHLRARPNGGQPNPHGAVADQDKAVAKDEPHACSPKESDEYATNGNPVTPKELA